MKSKELDKRIDSRKTRDGGGRPTGEKDSMVIRLQTREMSMKTVLRLASGRLQHSLSATSR